ncbi:zinc finger, LIM-type protein [Pseudohyphozyma bogoriensis]|nr:zinc finger, LIM-type protein [Pseudohyphozyma bogoriensis]
MSSSPGSLENGIAALSIGSDSSTSSSGTPAPFVVSPTPAYSPTFSFSPPPASSKSPTTAPTFAFDGPDDAPSSSVAPSFSVTPSDTPSFSITTDDVAPGPSFSISPPIDDGAGPSTSTPPWHPDCFVCEEEDCEERLEHVQFEVTEEEVDDEEQDDGYGGMEAGEAKRVVKRVWCMVHFEERFARTCFHCKTPIADSSYLTITDARLLPATPATRTYHALHFFCADCGDPFVDPKSLSPAKSKEEAKASPYMVHKGHAYCERCKRPLDGNYLIEDDEDATGGFDRPYCIPCYNIKATEDAHRRA